MFQKLKNYYNEPFIHFVVNGIIVYGLWKVILKASMVIIPFKEKWESMMDFFLNIIVSLSAFTLNLLGYEIVRNGAFIAISGTPGVKVGPACVGVGVMFTFVGLILAYKGPAKLRTYFIFSGLFFILFLNSLRVSILAIISENHYEWVEFNHKYVFNNLLYICVLLVWIWYVNLSNKEIGKTTSANEIS